MPNGVTVNIDYDTLNTQSNNIKTISTIEIGFVESKILDHIRVLPDVWEGDASQAFITMMEKRIPDIFEKTMQFGEMYAEAMDDVVEKMRAQEEATQARNSSDLSGT